MRRRQAEWAGTARPAVYRGIIAAISDPKMKARLAELGAPVIGGSSANFGKLIAEETEKWAYVIRAAHIKTE